MEIEADQLNGKVTENDADIRVVYAISMYIKFRLMLFADLPEKGHRNQDTN